jgi:hypothetical protein
MGGCTHVTPTAGIGVVLGMVVRMSLTYSKDVAAVFVLPTVVPPWPSNRVSQTTKQ